VAGEAGEDGTPQNRSYCLIEDGTPQNRSYCLIEDGAFRASPEGKIR
jgi:hypothetical protein